MNQTAISMLERRRNKSIAVVLGKKERDLDHFLPRDVSDGFRKVVLDQFNDLHEFTMDVLKSLDTDDVTINDYYLDLIEEIHSELVGNNGGPNNK